MAPSETRFAARSRKPAKRSRGRPHGGSAAIIRAVLDATLDDLGMRGYADLSVEDIAERAGVNKTSVYRRWPTKRDLVLAALEGFRDDSATLQDTGGLRSDLFAYLRSIAIKLSVPRGRSIARAIMAESDDLAELARWLRQRHYAAPSPIFERAIARGELGAATDTALLIELLSAPVFHRALIIRETVDDGFLGRVIDVVLHGVIGRHPPRAVSSPARIAATGVSAARVTKTAKSAATLVRRRR
jgi:AcrR family transcriptional regulator